MRVFFIQLAFEQKQKALEFLNEWRIDLKYSHHNYYISINSQI